MNSSNESTLQELQKLVGEFEGVVRATLGAAGEHAGAAAEELTAGMQRARDCVTAFEKEIAGGVARRARSADQSVRDQPWTAIGVAAIAAFVLGVLVSRHRQSE